MSENKDNQQTPAKFFEEFATGTGLRLWLVFLFCFFFLGYPVPLCILLGAAGGFGGAVVIGWWKSKDEAISSQPEEPEDVEEIEDSPARVSGLRAARQRRDARTRRRSQGFLMPFNFLRR